MLNAVMDKGEHNSVMDKGEPNSVMNKGKPNTVMNKPKPNSVMNKPKTINPAADKTNGGKTPPPVKKERASAFYTAVNSVILFLTGFIIVCTGILAVNFVKLMRDRVNYEKENAALSEKAETDMSDTDFVSEFDAKMRNINPDYICRLKIEGTSIDYPVVRGGDNEKYLSVSFYGEENVFGSVFMDYRCAGKYVPHIIIYGHNAKTGEVFGGLRKFLDKEYLKEHPVITLTVNDRIAEYEIFSARKTDVKDFVYNLNFPNPDSFRDFADKCKAPQDAPQILTLSTCVSGLDKDERVVVQGALIGGR